MHAGQPLQRNRPARGAFALGEKPRFPQMPANSSQSIGVLGVAARFVLEELRRLIKQHGAVMENGRAQCRPSPKVRACEKIP